MPRRARQALFHAHAESHLQLTVVQRTLRYGYPGFGLDDSTTSSVCLQGLAKYTATAKMHHQNREQSQTQLRCGRTGRICALLASLLANSIAMAASAAAGASPGWGAISIVACVYSVQVPIVSRLTQPQSWLPERPADQPRRCLCPTRGPSPSGRTCSPRPASAPPSCPAPRG